MKNYQSHLPAVLLLSYVIYSAFVPVTIAHSIITFSLAVLYGVHFHISRQEIHKQNQQSLDSLKNEMELKITALKEQHEKKLTRLEDEMGKVQLNHLPTKSVSSSPSPRKVVF